MDDAGGKEVSSPGRGLAPGVPGLGWPGPRLLSGDEILTCNGIQATLISEAAWHKSTFSGPNGDCVEAAELPAGVAVRNSRFPDGPALLFTEAEWDAFLRGVKGGDFG